MGAAELVFLTVPDDAIAEVAGGLAALDVWRPGQIVIHCSGRHGLEALEAAAAKGAIPMAIHPAMTFTGTSLDLDRMVGATFAVTAPGAFLPIAQALVVEMGGEPLALEDAARPLYHAALVHGGNHVVTLVTQAAALLAAAGVEEPGRVLLPLVHASVEGALSDAAGAVTTLTGPVVRGDAGTVAAHVAALEHRPEALHAYRAMALATADLALVWGTHRTGAIRRPHRRPREGLSMHVAHNAAELAELAPPAGKKNKTRAVVMTMGALHEGHLALVRAAREAADQVIVTVFVNPLQFDDPVDLERYPRDLDADCALLEPLGVDIVFAPQAEDMYPGGDPLVRVCAGSINHVFEGAHRPGHFDGMLTVVLKLLNLTRPDLAFFGQKDAQQVIAIRAMCRDFILPVEIVVVPTVRDADGLALSSRNCVPVGGRAGRCACPVARAWRGGPGARRGRPDHPGARGGACRVGGGSRRDTRTTSRLSTLRRPSPSPTTIRGEVIVAVAARVGATRLIDNIPVARRTARGRDRNHDRRRRRVTFSTLQRPMMISKIHRATVTQADLHYVGSITIDQTLMEAADLIPGQQVDVVDVTNGARLTTYAIPGEADSGDHLHQRRGRALGARGRPRHHHRLRTHRRRGGQDV